MDDDAPSGQVFSTFCRGENGQPYARRDNGTLH